MREFTEQEKVRREKVNALKEKGIKPFGDKIDITSNSKIIKDNHLEQTKEELEEIKDEVVIAGRIMTKRRNGKAGFFHIQDKYGQIQIYIRLDNVKKLTIYLKLQILVILLVLKVMYLKLILVNFQFMQPTIFIL